MIMMEQPSISLNSHDVPGPRYKMSETVVMAKGTKPLEVVSLIANAQKRLLQNKAGLKNIVINCHGYEGGYGLATGGVGEVGFDISNVALFGQLQSLGVGPIWLVACQAARGAPGTAFCQRLAVCAGTSVVAGEDNQSVGAWDTYRYYAGLSGQIDDYEGIVYKFTPSGKVRKDIDPEEEMLSVKT